MKILPFLLPALFAAPSSALDSEIRGRVICEVTGSSLDSEIDKSRPASLSYRGDFSEGMSLYFEYALDASKGLSISLGEPRDRGGMIDEPISAKTFNGVSRFTNVAEYRAAYSEFSFGRFGMSYRGSDQLAHRNCFNSMDWSGHFIRAHVSGHSKQVVSSACRPFVDAANAILDRLRKPGWTKMM